MNRETGRHFSKLGLAYFIASILFAAVQTLTVFVMKKFAPSVLENQTLSFLIPMLATYVIGVPLMALVIRQVPKGGQIQSCDMTKKQWGVTFLICYAGMYLANMIGTTLTNVIGQLKGSGVSNEILDVAFSNDMWANILVMVLLAPVIEELLFRKMLIDRTIQYGEGISVFLSALFFGLFHGNLNQFAYAFVIGGVFGFVYVKTGNIKYTIAMHMLINFISSVISMSIIKLAGLDELLRMQNDLSGAINPMEIMNIVTNHMVGFAILGIYLLIVFALVIIGVVLFFKYMNKIHLVSTAYTVQKGQRFRAYFLNPGMLLFVILWCVKIVMQLVM